MASEFGTSPWTYVTGEPVGTVDAIVFDHMIWSYLEDFRRKK